MKLDFKPTRWNCYGYQVEGVGDGFYHFLILGIPYDKDVPGGPPKSGETSHQKAWAGLYRTKDEAMNAAQRYEDQRVHNTDLSDEVARNAADDSLSNSRLSDYVDGWQECRRRAEILISEERRKAFEAGWDSAVGTTNYDRERRIDEAHSAYEAREGEGE